MINETIIEKFCALKIAGAIFLSWVFAGVQAVNLFESWGSTIIALAGSAWGLYIAIQKGVDYLKGLRAKRVINNKELEAKKKRIQLELDKLELERQKIIKKKDKLND